jgi:hypothetical protein
VDGVGNTTDCVTDVDGVSEATGCTSELGGEIGAGETWRGAAQAASNIVNKVIKVINGGTPCQNIFLMRNLQSKKSRM